MFTKSVLNLKHGDAFEYTDRESSTTRLATVAARPTVHGTGLRGVVTIPAIVIGDTPETMTESILLAVPRWHDVTVL